MDTIVLLVAVVAGLVALELLGMRAYRRHRARKQAAFTRENVGAVYDDLQAARSAGRPEDGAVLDALAAGERAHLAAIEAFRGPLHAESVDPAAYTSLPSSLDDALRVASGRLDDWSTGACRDAAARARVRGYRDIAKLYRQLQEVEQAAACLCLDMAEGARPAGLFSLCPACGLVVAGRRPAFCTVCAKPGFEFDDVAMPAMPEAAAAMLKPEGVA